MYLLTIFLIFLAGVSYVDLTYVRYGIIRKSDSGFDRIPFEYMIVRFQPSVVSAGVILLQQC